MHKGFAQILILGLVTASIILAGAFYMKRSKTCHSGAPLCGAIESPSPTIQPSPSVNPESTSSANTANWKTYKSDNFSFKYPNNWNLIILNNHPEGVLLWFVVQPPPAPNSEFPAGVAVEVFENPKNLTAADFINMKIDLNAKNNDFKSISVGGLQGQRGPLGGATINDNVILTYKGNVYQIRLDHSTRSEFDIDVKTFNQILSNFKFTQ